MPHGHALNNLDEPRSAANLPTSTTSVGLQHLSVGTHVHLVWSSELQVITCGAAMRPRLFVCDIDNVYKQKQTDKSGHVSHWENMTFLQSKLVALQNSLYLTKAWLN